MASLGLVSRAALGKVAALDDETLLARHRTIPLVRITPTAIVPSSLDPGGRSWIVAVVAWLVVLRILLLAGRRRLALERHRKASPAG